MNFQIILKLLKSLKTYIELVLRTQIKISNISPRTWSLIKTGFSIEGRHVYSPSSLLLTSIRFRRDITAVWFLYIQGGKKTWKWSHDFEIVFVKIKNSLGFPANGGNRFAFFPKTLFFRRKFSVYSHFVCLRKMRKFPFFREKI